MLDEEFSTELAARHIIHDILIAARQRGYEGAVARHLVGASLQLAFPRVPITSYESLATNDLEQQEAFLVGDTMFHVSVVPTPTDYERCKCNIDDGFRAYLLVPDKFEVGARQNAEITAPGQISVQSIESFVSQSIEEHSTFSKDMLSDGFRRLLETYNQRVNAVENDKSVLIEIPSHMLR